MEFYNVHKPFNPSHLGEEKHQMLNLNRRLETYLGRVKHLEEENMLLAEEIQTLRWSNQGASAHRKGLEEELQQARLELEAAWKARLHTEVEVGRLTRELQTLDLQRQKEVEAQMEVKMNLNQSRKELEEENRAQIWLREKIIQLEQEMKHLIQTHQEDVAHLEATLTHSRHTVPATLAQRGSQMPNLLQMGQEYSQRANEAWHEAAQAYQGQLAQLEESLNQARSRLTQVGQEKSENLLKLKALEKELSSAQDVRLHLERTAAQRRDKHSQEIQQLQEHLEGLEAEKEDVGRRIDQLLMENRGLLQLKMSLGLEVATYRALLDNESLRRDVTLVNQPRNNYTSDAVYSLRGRTEKQQLTANLKNTFSSSVCGIKDRSKPVSITQTPLCSRTTHSEAPKTSRESTEDQTGEETTNLKKTETHPKVLQGGEVEAFSLQEDHEKFTLTELLSAPQEQEPAAETISWDKEEEEDWKILDAGPVEESPAVSYQVESVSELTDEVSQQFAPTNLTPYHVKVTEQASDESEEDVPLETPVEKEELQQLHAAIDTQVEKEVTGSKYVKEETSDSETEAVLEPTFESRTSSPASECEPEENLFNQEVDISQDENISNTDAVLTKQDNSLSVIQTNETEAEDKLYPDGEEMDILDSVIERKADPKQDDVVKQEESNRQHAEPEEDISAHELEHEKKETRLDFSSDLQQDDSMTSSVIETHADYDRSQKQLPEKEEENDEDEDSQNVSVSWRTEVESDSYAQDNTLADTRPLIQYKSDETDAHPRASHVDNSESSEGDQEKKASEAGAGSESKSMKFGTMEDLCEDVEGEGLDEEYDLGYTHVEERDVEGKLTTSEHAAESTNIDEGDLEENTEMDEEDKEELETDMHVEEEMENLCADSDSANFANESEAALEQNVTSVQESTEYQEVLPEQQLPSSQTIIDQPSECLDFSDPAVEVLQMDSLNDHNTQHSNQEDMTEKREEDDKLSASMVEYTDVAKDQSDSNDVISSSESPTSMKNSDMKESNQGIHDSQQDVAYAAESEEATPVQDSNKTLEHAIEDAADCKASPTFAETAECDVLQSPKEAEAGEESDNAPESGQRCLFDADSCDQDTVTQKEDLDDKDIFVVDDSSETLKTNGDNNNGIHGFFGSGVENDIWLPTLGNGATCHPEDAQQSNQNLGFSDSLDWGISGNQNEVNGNSGMDKKNKEQEPVEVKQVLSRNVAEEDLIHSDDEGKCWSSEDE